MVCGSGPGTATGRSVDGVHDDQSGHGLNNRHGTRNDTGVVTALGLEDTLGLVVGDGALRLANGSCGLEAYGKVDVGAI